MSTVQIEIQRADLRAFVQNVRDGDFATAVASIAAAFIDAADIEAQTAGYYLDAVADSLSDDDEGDDE